MRDLKAIPSIELSKFATNGLKKIYQKGYKYKKAGVIVMDFINESNKDIVRLAAQSHGRTWKMRQEKLSNHYTTNINEILEVH